MKKLISLAAGVALFALATGANAAQPLTDSQMDGVSAGGVAIANGASVALGEVTADTITVTSTNVDTVFPGIIAVSQAFSQGAAAGGFLFQAASISHVDTAASL